MVLGLQNASDRQAGRQAEAPCLMPEGEGREEQQMGERGDGASDFSLSQVLCKAWKTPLGWQASVSPAGLECEVGEINSIQLGNAMQIATYGEWERNRKRPVKTEKWAKRKQLCGHGRGGRESAPRTDPGH